MKQYCRYCCNLTVGDVAYCSAQERIISEASAKAQNRCSDFLYNPIDAFGGIDKDGKTHEYAPRKPKKMQCDGQMSLELLQAAGVGERRNMKAVVKYPGSKWSIADWIISFFPPHHSYVEPFFGSGAVLFNKPRSNIETVNDLDGNVVNLFEWIKNDPEKLAHEIYYTPYARAVYETAYSMEPEDSLQKAVNFYIRLNMGHGFRTNGEKVGWKSDVQGREKAYAATDWVRLPEKIIQAAERLRGVQIENRPALEVMEKFNYPNVLMYIDPPYVKGTRHGKQYRHEMYSEESHAELIEAAAAHKGPVLISGYDSPLYREKLSGWHREEHMAYTQVGKLKTEILWMNFDPARQINIFECGMGSS